MTAINLKAHFDGTSIQLDEPHNLPTGEPLPVTVLVASADDPLIPGWSELGQASVARAYGSSEPEYSESDLRP
jgi:hypothetical protein